jgi:hypothetical protein
MSISTILWISKKMSVRTKSEGLGVLRSNNFAPFFIRRRKGSNLGFLGRSISIMILKRKDMKVRLKLTLFLRLSLASSHQDFLMIKFVMIRLSLSHILRFLWILLLYLSLKRLLLGVSMLRTLVIMCRF